jgi:AcrR family transcriptional regulator
MSPAATRTVEDAGVAVLVAADRLFYERGVAGVGMDDVRDAAGVSLRRLYSLYPSKRDLVAAWLRDRHERWMTWFRGAVDASTAHGADPLVATFDAIEAWASSPSYRGCAFLNIIAETTEIDAEHRAIAADHKRELVQYLASLAATTHADAPAWLPSVLGVLIDGAIVQAAVFGSVDPVRDARRAAAQLLGLSV